MSLLDPHRKSFQEFLAGLYDRRASLRVKEKFDRENERKDRLKYREKKRGNTATHNRRKRRDMHTGEK